MILISVRRVEFVWIDRLDVIKISLELPSHHCIELI